MGSNGSKKIILSEWSSTMGPFISTYLEKKHQIIDNYYDNTLENYQKIKCNEALTYINTLSLELQNGLLKLSEMAPNLLDDAITFKEEHQLKMLEVLYAKKFVNFLVNINMNSSLQFDDTMSVRYDSKVYDFNNETHITKNISITINIKNCDGFVGYEINNI